MYVNIISDSCSLCHIANSSSMTHRRPPHPCNITLTHLPRRELMTIKNETAFTKECMEGAMRASNFDNSRYKTFKLIYNMFGLIFGMMMIRELVLKMTGNEQADTFMIVLFGLVAVVFLYIGMIGMDKSNKKKFHNIYGKMVGIKFTYEIDAENIIITDEENDSDTFSWNEVVKWNQDPDNIYLFVGDDNCLVVSKKGFTQGSADDLRQLADAVIGMRNVTGNSQQ